MSLRKKENKSSNKGSKLAVEKGGLSIILVKKSEETSSGKTAVQQSFGNANALREKVILFLSALKKGAQRAEIRSSFFQLQ